MKNGDKVKINKKGIFDGLEGTITGIRYYVTLSTGYEAAFDSDDLIPNDKTIHQLIESASKGLKSASNDNSEKTLHNQRQPKAEKIAKLKKVVSDIEAKPKRKYQKKIKS